MSPHYFKIAKIFGKSYNMFVKKEMF